MSPVGGVVRDGVGSGEGFKQVEQVGIDCWRSGLLCGGGDGAGDGDGGGGSGAGGGHHSILACVLWRELTR